MASAVEPPSFPRSRSSPDVVSLPPFAVGPNPSHSHRRLVVDPNKRLPDLPAFDLPSFNSGLELDTSSSSSGPKGPKPAPERQPEPPPHEGALDKLPRNPAVARSKTASLIDRPRSWLLSGSRSSRAASTSGRRSRSPSPAVQNGAPDMAEPRPSERPLSTSASFAAFARWSWTASSRSPSPRTVSEPPAAPKAPARATPSKLSRTPPERLQLLADADTVAKQTAQGHHVAAGPRKPGPMALGRTPSYFKAKQKSPGSDGPDSDNSCASSSTSLGHRASNSGKTSASQSICSDGNANTPITDESSNEMPPPLRDPLWSSFKKLDVELRDFASKQPAQLVGRVRALVLPLLRGTMNHKSVKSLGLEDIERRAVVLNKWWMAILDILHDRAQPLVPGVDRPALLEAATLLMMRPEWRRATTYLLPLADRSPSERVRSRSWTNASDSTTASSDQSTLLAESAEHNVRTMFVANLVRQMSYVVEKMSVRHAPLSLVNFSGKTCAYAFFFAPSVADVLVRLWGLTPELIRRTAAEFGLPRRDSGESDDIVALFPPKLGQSGWTSARAMWDMLKQIPRMSLLVARIPWTGPWVSRWKGRDTDLFFIFCKYFHVLSDQFMPQGLPVTEKARSPAFVLVHAQLLSILDTTIHRHTAIEHAYGPPLIDTIHGAEASALAMPLPPTNLMKGMSENRLVILLRDCLTDDASEMAGARHTFAEAFTCLMKGATCRTSQFNSAACFTLCDFLEEAIKMYHEFESQGVPANYVDWELWLEVCKRVLGSLNTMSEVRVLSFLYSVWDALAKDPRRKAAFCLDWLLTEETFDAFFNNWCPMVRAYYQRLLCWRICRDDGNANEVDIHIMSVASTRLRTVWSHYLHLKRSAEEAGRAPPSTIPMCPTLGKKLMIVRQEVNAPQQGLLMGFDTFARPGGDALPGNGHADGGLVAKGDAKKRWSLLGKVLSMTTGSAAVDGPTRGAPAADEPLGARRGGMELSMRPALSNTAKGSPRAAATEPDSRGSSPVFDEPKYTFKFILGWHQQTSPTVGRDLTRPRLPAPAQSQVSARALDAGRGASTSPAARHAREAGQDGPSAESRRSSVSDSVEEWLRGTATGETGVDKETWSAAKSSAGGKRRYSSAGQASRGSASAQVQEKPQTMESLTRAVKPVGMYAKNSVYSGRALAEWAQVVSECNSFTERRRDEGVGQLCDVEVPQLGVEGFRKIGG